MGIESQILWRGNITFSEESISNVANQLISDPRSDDDGVHTSFNIGDIHTRPEIMYLDQYKHIVSKIIFDLNMSEHTSNFDYWCQVYDGAHTEHMHYTPTCLLSFVHFIRPVGEFFHFTRPNGQRDYPKQEKGDIIVFPSWTKHSVDPSYGNQRVVIAANIHFDRVCIDQEESFSITTVRPGRLYIAENHGQN